MLREALGWEKGMVKLPFSPFPKGELYEWIGMNCGRRRFSGNR
jgi:hypothetical protein